MNLTVNTKQAKEFLITNIKAGLVTMLHGDPGIGKSDLVNSVAKDFKLYPIDLRASQLDPTDVNGFGMVVEGKATYVPFDIFPLESTPIPKGCTGFMLFLDEINSASKAVEAALYKILLDRKVGQKKLHPKTAIVAAGNLVTSGAIVNRQSTATQSRLVHLELAVDPNLWIEWASQNNLDYKVISYISSMPNELHQFDPRHNDKTFACPRTWEFVSRVLKVTGNIPLHEQLVNLAGMVGEGAARQFVAFCETLVELPSIKEILASPLSATLSTKPSLLHAASHLVASNMNTDNVETLIDYVERMPVEFQTITLQNAIFRDRNLVKHDRVITWIDEKGDNFL